MKKTFPIVMLPTEKADSNSIIKYSNCKLMYNNAQKHLYLTQSYLKSIDASSNHLYILSDEEIKEDDWQYDRLHGVLLCKNPSWSKQVGAKKIVATTDKSLKIRVKQYFVEVDNEDMELFELPQLPESFIKEYIKAYNEGNPITEVDLEMIKCCGRCDDIHDECQGDILKTTPNNEVVVCYKKEPVIGLYTKIHVARLCLKMQHDYSKFKESCHYGPNMREIAEWTDKWLEENL